MGNCFISKPSSTTKETHSSKDKQENKLKVDMSETKEEKNSQSPVKETKENKNQDIHSQEPLKQEINNIKKEEEKHQEKVDQIDAQVKNKVEITEKPQAETKQLINQTSNQMTQDDAASKIEGLDDKKKKRGKVKAKKVLADIQEESQILESIIKRERSMTPADIHANKKSLGNHFVFALLQDQDKEEIIKKMFYCENKSDFVFKQGDQASSYFIIEKGECEIIINGDKKKTIKNGDCFGELALLYGAPRSASVRAVGICGFWAIDRNTFKKAIADIVHRESSENRSFIEKIKFFSNIIL